jgi:hypothetical protein
MRIDKTSSDGLRLAVRLWMGIDAPARFNDEETMPRQQNLWVVSGSGSRPSV